MKLTLFLFLVSVTSVLASKSYSQTKILNLSRSNATVKEVLKNLEDQSEFYFLYSEDIVDVNRKVNVTIENKKIDQALNMIFEGTDVNFSIRDRIVVLTTPEVLNGQLDLLQQYNTVKGTVTDESGMPLPGATVIVKGTTEGTITDSEGKYLIEAEQGTVLQFSFVGMRTQEVEVGNQNSINISLQTDAIGLDEVVAIGYGTRKKSDLTGAVVQIDEKSIKEGSTMTPEMALQGRMAGVFVSSQGTNPNARPTIRIRGVSTLGHNDPLFVIDGVPITEFGAENQNPFTMINPNDIETMTVLKDASATAIYGVRASNGVILIQTKRGRKGELRINLSASYGIQNIKERYDMLETQEYVKYMREALANNTVTDMDPKWKALYIEDPSYPAGYYLGDVIESYDKDWQDEMLNKNAPVQDYNLSISGGNEKSTFSFSAGYSSQESAFKGNELDRYSFAVNSDHQLNDWFKVGETFRYAITMRDYPGVDTPNSSSVGFQLPAPWMPVYRADGPNGYTPHMRTLGDGSSTGGQGYGPATADHALGQMSMIINKAFSNRALTSFYAEVEPFDGFRLKGTVSYDWNNQQSDFMINEGIGYFKTWGSPASDGNTYEDRSTNNRNLIKEFTIFYNAELKKHSFDLVLNAMDQSILFDYSSVQQIHFPFFDWNMRGIQSSASSDDKIAGSYISRSALQGYMGRLSYNYDSKYYIDATVRRDGSSRFAPGYKWGTFPSFALAWRISSESFMEDVSWINDLKLRGGWGQTGNQETAEFSYISLMNINPSYATGSGEGVWPDDNLNPGAYAAQFPVEDLSWETVSTTSFGFDGIFLDNSIDFTAEYYYRFTDDILQTANLTLLTGIPNYPKVNLAQVSNKGFEFSLGLHKNFGEIKIDANANITTVRNRVEKLYIDQPGGVEVGYPINYIYGYVMEGIFQTQAEVDEYKATMQDNGKMNQLAPGDIRFADLYGPPAEGATGKEKFKTYSPDNKVDSYDRTYLGKTIPGYFYGFNVTATYKQWDFGVTFRGIGDVQKVNYDRQRREDMRGTGANMFASVKDRWTPENQSTTMPRAIYYDPSDNRRLSSRWVEDGDFLRLDNLQIGYTLPNNLLNSVRVKGGRISLTATNLFVLTPYSGIDPEKLIPTTVKLGMNFNF
ncbi:TonB-dependent receptor [uncultured Draconibacterium sp.]|uniref:TonB-dependent receptor n=1 Tax=uncultured Draconibacterium sp. TaxID=1573823 RepID=UPI0029C76EA8|nr:TonB-dependent receptor [uncultured Draconibacterium sp.]